MLMRGYTREFAQRVFAQIEGFGEYGFPESHAASFALLVYVSCWLKRHHPDAFLAALLNAQPMGFYAPAQLVRDAQDHGVVVHGVHVNHSHWFTGLEPPDSHGAYGGNGGDGENGAERVSLWAVRLGLHMVAGLPEAAALRLVHAREEDGCFESIQALADRASLSKQELEALAAANALSGLSAHRHDANWQAAGHERSHVFLAHAKSKEPALAPDLLPAPSQAQDIVSDYASLGLSLGTHPLSLLRPMLTQRFQSLSMATLRNYPHGRLARASGLVTHRQRPSTAKGILFMTLEDETGRINVVVWPDVLDRYRHPTLHGQLITVYGRWQRDENIPRDAPGQVLNLLAMRIEDHTPLLAEALGLLATESRDFR
jgi:error-prone DNA polymerase